MVELILESYIYIYVYIYTTPFWFCMGENLIVLKTGISISNIDKVLPFFI